MCDIYFTVILFFVEKTKIKLESKCLHIYLHLQDVLTVAVLTVAVLTVAVLTVAN